MNGKHASRRQSRDTYFFFNDTATTEIYTLSLHDALPISQMVQLRFPIDSGSAAPTWVTKRGARVAEYWWIERSEEHTSELQSRLHLVCRLLLEKKKQE